MSVQIELVAVLSPGRIQAPEVVNPDGTVSSFVIPANQSFIATDISANRTGVVGAPVLVALNLEQTVGTGIVARWQFVGQVSANIERAFVTGIRFAAPFKINLLSSSGDTFAVRIRGFFA